MPYLLNLVPHKKLNIKDYVELQDYNNKKFYNNSGFLDYIAKKKHDKILDS